MDSYEEYTISLPRCQFRAILPDVTEIRLDTHKLVVVEYQEWKERVKTRQERGEQ
jgi:hypothetical protein